MKLVIANKNYSSWSMRPWLLLKHFDIPFDEVLVLLRQADTHERILEHSPSGRVPALVCDEGHVVWDSLAIAETLAERYPAHRLWPADPIERAHARSISAEMHSGFSDIREAMPMNIKMRRPDIGQREQYRPSVSRIDALWRACLAKHDGPFLFGEFGIADAMYAPVVMRFMSYEPVGLSSESRAYMERVKALPAVVEWIAGSQGEPAIAAYDEIA
ncbi:glutathione S-transferase family protein [Pararobbsia silviterrae]|uniref:Glutathione S-transferase family protein n=1 Tax=Pararobbsia silviterrae TaxID=1792498 RepID=A0A494Y7H7_9BURK|nr:glutathione S-transferase family protein [Pararobbsia silviterrae]RKP58651.1 glutathione S-transferase family protein [Pararobbsia silviterrae]